MGGGRASRCVRGRCYSRRVLLTGTIRKAGEVDRIAAEGPDYESARLGLFELVPEGYQIIAIRTDRDG